MGWEKRIDSGSTPVEDCHRMTLRLAAILLLVVQPLASWVSWSAAPTEACGPSPAIAERQGVDACCCAAMGDRAPEALNTCPCTASAPTEAPTPVPEPAPAPDRPTQIVTIPAASPALVVATPPSANTLRADALRLPLARTRSAARAGTGIWRT